MKKLMILIAAAATAASFGAAQAADKVDFLKQIKPILDETCVECHGPDKQKGKLRLDLKEEAFKEDYNIIPGKPEESEVYKRISLPPDDIDIMPSKGDPLSKEQIDLIALWIKQGAEWPEQTAAAATAPNDTPSQTADADAPPDFHKVIAPILEASCYECHGPEKQKGKLRLDLKEEAFKEDYLIVAGKPDESELYKRIVLPPDHDDIMPAKGDPLPKEQIELIKKWISSGAKWPDAPAAAADGKVDFVTQIQPILLKSCIECHGPEKQKGKLRLDLAEEAFKEDYLIVAGKPDDSELYKRIALPEGHDDIMPAKGDPLTKQQIELIQKWIQEGADWPQGHVVKLPEPKKKSRLDANFTPTEEEKRAVAELDEQGISVRPIAMNLNWTEANLRLQGPDKADQVLPKLKDVTSLIALNLAETNIRNEHLAHLSGLTNLHRLHLEKTAITDQGLQHLKNLQHLQYLNLYGTEITDAGLQHLKDLKNLENIYLWQTKVSDEGVQQLQAALPETRVVRGWDLTPPAEEKKEEEQKEAKKD